MARWVKGGKERVWRERLRRFDASRLTVVEFCESEGVSSPSFYQWRKRIAVAREAVIAGREQRPEPFVPVRWTPSAVVEIHLPNGARVCVPPGDNELLRMAIDAAGRLGTPNQSEEAPC